MALAITMIRQNSQAAPTTRSYEVRVTLIYGSQRYRHTTTFVTLNGFLAELLQFFAVLYGDAIQAALVFLEERD